MELHLVETKLYSSRAFLDFLDLGALQYIKVRFLIRVNAIPDSLQQLEYDTAFFERSRPFTTFSITSAELQMSFSAAIFGLTDVE